MPGENFWRRPGPTQGCRAIEEEKCSRNGSLEQQESAHPTYAIGWTTLSCKIRISDRGLPCHEFEPSTTKDPPCRAAMHVKYVES
ncbi:hypothetical protein TNCV_2990571 [Trichonephila clavipes]|nr:hypothetical protein TNCV_2990571 [Trichonephila clavipes]